LVNLSRTISGFSGTLLHPSYLFAQALTPSLFAVGYYQMSWGAKAGFDVSFGSKQSPGSLALTMLTMSASFAVQAGIVGAGTLLVLVLIFTGERVRKLGGPLHFATGH
jgi:hypothetical protein